CKSVDIRNSIDIFAKLDNCEVIEGFLQILLIDNVNETDFLKIKFPLLTEITDYLLLYRVNGLRSIGQLFPNLTVIRGQTLFYSYSFVIFEMSSLQEIGLNSLTDITRGMVQIDKNPSLCFVHTIDWDIIVHDKSERNFIKSLKPENECPVCPGDMGGKGNSANDSVGMSCPRIQRTNVDNFEKDRHLCWNKNHCQKICPDNCTACNDIGQCCSSLCLGGCSNNNPNECKVCRNFTMGFGKNKKCMRNCPEGYFKFLNRRCITRKECIQMPKPYEVHTTNEVEYPYKIFNNSCVLHCPTNYKSDYRKHECTPCGGRCEKYCDGINIDSIQLAKQLRGCTHIKGSLEIQIRGGSNVVNELEENLSMIEEISGYLKVVRSFSLVSLNFLKSLKRIRGDHLESQKYVLFVLDNQNLQELWDLSKNRTIKIHKGRIFFHFNPKLCMDKIEKLVQMFGLKDINPLEVATNSNGDKIACNVTKLEVNIADIASRTVILKWNQFIMDDQRKLLGYIVYCIEAPYRNVTMYDGRDACGQDNWRVYDVPFQQGDPIVTQPLPNLKPYSQYAFYVKTYTIVSDRTDRTGALSDIQYFTTKPSMPSSPTNLQVISNSSDSLKITWGPPARPNGNITHYIISGKKHSNGDTYSKDRDYCKDPAPVSKPVSPQTITTASLPSKNDTCPCEDGSQTTKLSSINEIEEAARIKFEDELQNQVYVKRTRDTDRTKREVMTAIYKFPNNTDTQPQGIKNNEILNVTENGTDIWESEKVPNDIESSSDADNIRKVHITNQSLDTVTIEWEQPKDPNGVIFTISVQYRRIDIDNAKPTTECKTSNNSNNGKMDDYTIKKLIPGNYSLRIMATSSAGEGQYSPYIYFYIKEPTPNTLMVVPVVLIVFLVVLLFLYWLYRKHQKERENMRLIQSVNPEYVPSVYIPDDWEVPRKKIELIKELGQGSFGMVWEGLARDIRGKSEVRCAIKTVNEHATNRSTPQKTG
ncbi:hypothetical protein NQ317_009915, partial [Molorchus minor]